MQTELHEPVHHLTLRVLYADTDAGGVVYHGSYLRFCEQGRTEMVRHSGLPYRTLEERGLILPVTECGLRYKAPARYDDLLCVGTSLAQITRYTCRFHYRISRNEDSSTPRLLALAFTVHACVDRQGRLRPLPGDVLSVLQELRPQQPDCLLDKTRSAV